LRTVLVRGWRPELVLRLGAPWASRVVNEWLAGLGCTQVLVDPGGAWAVPDRPPGEVIVADPGLLCRTVADNLRTASPAPAPSDWARQWARADGLAQGAIDAVLAGEDGLTEPGIARCLVGEMRTGSTLVVSSSMPVREVEWWSRPRSGIRVLANRGANGIDGVLSTALGVAASSGSGPGGRTQVAALVGDLAFLCDAGALLRGVRSAIDLDVVVVDNDGGGIFSFLPQASSQPPGRFERLWGTPHGSDLVAVARGYGVVAEEVADLKSLAGAIAGSGEGKGLRVFVAKTDRAGTVAVHQRLNSAVEKTLEELAG
jgi:2-succinyl-5-enolpyruvyl-6-hydroxy-3-cyclohexene-1-carboxylate synthase